MFEMKHECSMQDYPLHITRFTTCWLPYDELNDDILIFCDAHIRFSLHLTNKNTMKKTLLIVLAVMLCAGILYMFMTRGRNVEPEARVTSFEECVAAGNAVMESNPRQCSTPDGAIFVENVPPPAPETPGTPDGEDARVGDGNGLDGSGEALAVRGTLTSISLEEMMVDGPARLTVTAQDGVPYTVLVPSMGLPLCAARANIADVSSLTAGELIEVRGETDADGAITPCSAPDHYLRKAARP